MENNLFKKLKANNIFDHKDLTENILYKFLSDNCRTLDSSQIPYENNNFFGAIYQLHDFISQNIKLIIDEIHSDLLASITLNRSFSNHIYSYIINHIISKLLISEKKLAIEHLLENSKNPEQNFICTITNNEEWINYFFSKYPITFYLISNFLEKQFVYVKNFLVNIISDYNELASTFSLKGDLLEVHIAQGDLHDKNKSVSKLIFDEGIIFYKPRSYEPEILLNSILKEYNLVIKIPKFLCKKTYGYSEFIINTDKEEQSFEKTVNYFYEIGRAIKLFTAFQFEDIINENVIYANGFLYLIDIECVFVPKLFSDQNRLKELSNVLSLSPLGTAAIPYKQSTTEYEYSILLPSRKTSKIIKNESVNLSSDLFIKE